MDERELNKAVCQIFIDYRETPHAVPQKIVDLIIKDRLRVVEPLVPFINHSSVPNLTIVKVLTNAGYKIESREENGDRWNKIL